MDLKGRQLSLHSSATALEIKANTGDLDASRELLAVVDQGMRAARLAEAKEKEINETLCGEMNAASARALSFIQSVLAPHKRLVEDKITKALLPYCFHEHVARANATQCDIINYLDAEINKRKIIKLDDVDAAASQLAMFQNRLSKILKGGAAWEFEGADKAAEESEEKAA
ncbi:MAG: hypothetical protein WDN28_15450 [Chthoniobacter sp.]